MARRSGVHPHRHVEGARLEGDDVVPVAEEHVPLLEIRKRRCAPRQLEPERAAVTDVVAHDRGAGAAVDRLDVVVPRSEFFGGNVSVGDLWVLEDIERAVRPLLESGRRPDLLVLPDSFLSRWGRDLRSIPYTELEATLGIDIVLVNCERIVL